VQTGLSIQELAARIERQQGQKRDFIVDTSAAEVLYNDCERTGSNLTIAFDGGEYPIKDTAHDQIAARLDIPAKYAKRMRDDAPGLYATNVNTWFRKNPERRMVRTLDTQARAFLSDRYQRIENEEIAAVAFPILADIPEVRVVSSEITDRRLYIQALSPRVQGEVKVGDTVQAGVIISNSEIGHGAVSVQALIYRLRCKNGMVSSDGYRKYHVGKRIDDNEALWADDTRKADDTLTLKQVRDMITAAVDGVRFQERLLKLQGLTEGKVTGDPAKAVEALAQKVGATAGEQGGILRSLIEGGDLSRWGLLNAVTAQAHTASSYDRSVELEVAGGALLDLPDTEWKRVLEAA
jgi:hypothetical protein